MRGHDNRAYFFEDAPDAIFCPECDSLKSNARYEPVALDIKTGMDLSSTYDNRYVCSERFVEACRALDIPGIEFKRIQGLNRAYFLPIVDRCARFDAIRRKTRFLDRCSTCGQFESVVGATPAYLVDKEPLGRGFFRSDLEFGSGRAKAPLLLIDLESGNRLKEARFVGTEFRVISA